MIPFVFDYELKARDYADYYFHERVTKRKGALIVPGLLLTVVFFVAIAGLTISDRQF